MRETPNIRQWICKLAALHDVTLEQPGAYLHLVLAPHGQLVLENWGERRLSLTNYIPVAGNLVADPQVVWYLEYAPTNHSVHPQDAVWLPIETNDLFDGWRLYADLSPQGDRLVAYDPVGQAALAKFCETALVRNLERYGWLEQGKPAQAARSAWVYEQQQARGIRFLELYPDTQEVET